MKTLILLVFLFTTATYAQNKDVVMNSGVPEFLGSSGDEQDPPDDIVLDTMPRPIHTPYPVYPNTARHEGLNGMVWLKLLISEDGAVKKSKVIKSTFTQNDMEKATPTVKLAVDSITLACVKAVGQWTFSPGIKNNKPVKAWVVLPFKFKLDAHQKDEKKQKK
jgi:protein TonB